MRYSWAAYKPHYKAMLVLALPIVVAQLGQILVQLADNIMVGQWGGDDPVPLAAVSFGSSTAMLVFLFGIGMAMGVTPLVGEMVGRGQHNKTAPWLFNGIVFYLLFGLFLMGLQLAVTPLLYHMGQPEEVVTASLPYYRIMAYSVPFALVFSTFKQFLEGLGNTWVSMIVLLACNLLNVLLNYILIYGAWGAPELGVAGAAWATFIARAISPFIMWIVFASVRRLRLYLQNWQLKDLSLRSMGALCKVSFPIAGQMFLESASFVFVGIMMGWLGTIAIGANQIANTIGNCVFMMVVAIGATATIRVSHYYGARNFEAMKLAAKASLHIVFAWNILAAIGLIIFCRQLPLIFTTNHEIIDLAALLLLCFSAYQPFDGLQNVSIGILRGIQDVKIIPLIAFLSYFVFNLPVGYVFAFVLGWGAKGLALSYVVGLSITAGLCLLRIRHQFHQMQK